MTDRELMQQWLDAVAALPEDIEGYLPESLTDLVIATSERLAQPEQQPVAWMYVNTDGECEQIEYIENDPMPDDPSVTPLYTTPRQWQGLTADEIWQCNAAPSGSAVEYHICMAHQNVLDFAEAIEARLKLKNA